MSDTDTREEQALAQYATARGEVRVFADGAAVARAAAEHVARVTTAVLCDGALARLALAGGSTPRATYQLLATPAWRDRIDWPRVEIYFGDERCVPPDHADSNYRMAREALLDHVPLGADRVHRIRGELMPEEAARAYEAVLRRAAADAATAPRLDLVLLGMGPDGHTASLFPGTAVLEERAAWAAPVYVPRLDSWRVTLTLPVLTAAAHVAISVVGAEKAEAFAAALGGPDGALPVQRVRPSAGELTWLVDRAAVQKWRPAG